MKSNGCRYFIDDSDFLLGFCRSKRVIGHGSELPNDVDGVQNLVLEAVFEKRHVVSSVASMKNGVAHADALHFGASKGFFGCRHQDSGGVSSLLTLSRVLHEHDSAC